MLDWIIQWLLEWDLNGLPLQIYHKKFEVMPWESDHLNNAAVDMFEEQCDRPSGEMGALPGTWEHAAHVTQSTVRPHMHRKWHPPLSHTKSRLHIFTAFLSNLEVFQPRIRCPYHFLEIPGCWTKVTNLARMSAHVITLYTGWHWPGGG